ncbi:MAG: hypothetical protein MUO42_01900 [Anaerolineaceae bacterium]|nr:hypothetical protein [Anaerolineaceae bacterium]
MLASFIARGFIWQMFLVKGDYGIFSSWNDANLNDGRARVIISSPSQP